jgi:mycothiol synthase
VASAWTLVDALDDATRGEVADLLATVERRESDEALTEDQREHLERDDAVQHALRRASGGALTGYAVVVQGTPLTAEAALGSIDVDLAVLLEGLGRPVTLLVREDTDAVAAAWRPRGWVPDRALRRLRRGLPAPPPPVTDLVVRGFEPGRDEAAWVAENNAAFAGHPTQSHMTVAKLDARVEASWFDPKGFLLFFDGDELVASCWTKVHHNADGDVGEIYVISVDPGAQRRGLGRLAVLSGLEHLASVGLTVAELFVEEDNTRAIALYEELGFRTVARVVELRFEPTSAQPAPTARPTP